MAAQWLCAVSATTVAGCVLLAGCGATKPVATPPAQSASSSMSSAASSPASPGAPATVPARPARTAPWIELQPGDCLAGPPPTDPAEVTVTIVDCATAHAAETYLRAELPVDAAVSDTATAQCEAGFARYTGAALPGSGYAIAYLIDSEQDRTSNNPYPSTVICLLQNAQGQPLTGPARR